MLRDHKPIVSLTLIVQLDRYIEKKYLEVYLRDMREKKIMEVYTLYPTNELSSMFFVMCQMKIR